MVHPVPVAVRRLDPDLPLPAYAHPGDAGADLLAAEDVELPAGGWRPVRTTAFSSARKWSAASFDGHGHWLIGAPEMLLARRQDRSDASECEEELGHRRVVRREQCHPVSCPYASRLERGHPAADLGVELPVGPPVVREGERQGLRPRLGSSIRSISRSETTCSSCSASSSPGRSCSSSLRRSVTSCSAP